MAIVGTCRFVAACLPSDRDSHGRVYPAFFWGGPFFMISVPVRFSTTQMDGWLALARWLTP